MADDFGTILQGEKLPDMLKFASWASLAAGIFAAFLAVMFFLGTLAMSFFQLVSLVFGNVTAVICLPFICLGGAVAVALFGAAGYGGIMGGLKALKGQKGGKLLMAVGALASVVVGFLTIWGGFGLISLALGGFILYVIFADQPSIKAFEAMDAEEWGKHPHDFSGKPEVTVSAEVAAEANASVAASVAAASAAAGAGAAPAQAKPAKAAKAAPAPAKWSGRAYEHGKVYHEAPANLMRGKEAVGGKVKITPEKVLFESHNVNIKTGATEIPIETISSFKKFKSLGVVNNGLTMVTSDGKEYKFVVDGRDNIEALVKDIQAAIAVNAVKTSEF